MTWVRCVRPIAAHKAYLKHHHAGRLHYTALTLPPDPEHCSLLRPISSKLRCTYKNGVFTWFILVTLTIIDLLAALAWVYSGVRDHSGAGGCEGLGRCHGGTGYLARTAWPVNAGRRSRNNRGGNWTFGRYANFRLRLIRRSWSRA